MKYASFDKLRMIGLSGTVRFWWAIRTVSSDESQDERALEYNPLVVSLSNHDIG